jgi:type II secretory pathway pseudopilin PulG
MSRRAFTLVELLVVIAIMITLMSLIMGGVMLAKRTALRAKTVSLIGAVQGAVDAYRSMNNTYPERQVLAADAYGFTAGLPDVYEQAFKSGGSTRAATDTGIPWSNLNEALVVQLGSLISEQAKNGVLIDAWNKPLRYRPAKWYAYTGAAGSKPRIDQEEPPGLDTFQLWSPGPDGKDDSTDPGEGGDDIPSWTKQP